METFGERVQRLRTAHGISQAELARQVGWTSGYVSLIEANKRLVDALPRHDFMLRLAEALKVDVSDLVQAPDEPNLAGAPEIQTIPLAALLKRIGATPYRGRPLEDIAASAGSGTDYHIPQGYDDARPVGKRQQANDPIQDVVVTGHCMDGLLYPGDVVSVNTRLMPQLGDVVVAVRFHEEMIVKFLRMKDDHQYLESRDGKILIPLDQYIRIVGPVVSVQKSMARLLWEAEVKQSKGE